MQGEWHIACGVCGYGVVSATGIEFTVTCKEGGITSGLAVIQPTNLLFVFVLQMDQDVGSQVCCKTTVYRRVSVCGGGGGAVCARGWTSEHIGYTS